ncbi:MAG: aldo/keto reductase [Hyphomicrobiaceae bacterium]|nr:MAG: aldo/keto reductase [Hyphomicrobiaceae bacterium]
MRTVTVPSGERVPALGLGTWKMGERASEHAAEVTALKLGLDLGFGLIDTAEMYGEGGAEEIVAEAIAGRRDSVFIVSKVYPHNASRKGAIAACERSLRRLKTGTIDMYLLHWRGSIPLAETVQAFERLKAQGKIRHWGMSNLDTDEIDELQSVPQGAGCACDQVIYHLGQRGIEWSLMDKCRNLKMPIMAYSPLGQGGILRNAVLRRIADKHAVAPAAVAIAWTLRRDHVISIPKASRADHVRENAKAESLRLDADDLSELDAAFPPPKDKQPLSII